MNMFTFSATFCCMLFCGFLGLVYFSKKNMLNTENKIYKNLVKLDFIILITSLICLISAYYFDIKSPLGLIYDISARIYCVAQLLWCIFLAIYTIFIIGDTNEKIAKIRSDKKLEKNLTIIIIILNIINFILPVNYSYDVNNVLTYTGPRTFYMIFLLISLAIITTIILIISGRKTNKKKILPFILFVILQTLAFIINLKDTAINIFPLSITLISYMMYHTIENPDFKLISELELAKNQADESNENKSKFLSSMSHEIRTPLNAILGLSQMIANSDNYEDMHSDSEDILVASQNLLEIVDGILEINNLESKKASVNEVVYKPYEEFENILKITNFRKGKKPLEVISHFSNNIPKILIGDIDKIKRISNNLLSNSIKYTKEGFIYFNVDCEVINDICQLTITVRDTGRGIKESEKKNLFTKFYRLEEDKDSDIQGTGLGLAITKELVDLLDGEISFESVENIGTTFKVVINQKIARN